MKLLGIPGSVEAIAGVTLCAVSLTFLASWAWAGLFVGILLLVSGVLRIAHRR